MTALAHPGLHNTKFPLSFDAVLRDVRHLAARAAGDLADWLVRLEVEGKADRTLYAYMRHVAALLREFPLHELGDFTPEQIEYVLVKTPKQSRYIPRSVYNQFFKWAYKRGRVDRNPMDLVADIPAGRRRPKDIFTEPEIARLIGLPVPDGPLLTLMFATGLRQGECRSCVRADIDLNRGYMAAYGKGRANTDRGKERIAALTNDAIVAVSDLDLFERLERHDHLWYSTTGHGKYRRRRTQISHSTFDRWWHKVVEQAGVRYLNPHQTRHTYAWLLRTKGFDIEQRQALLGHEYITTTEQYGGAVTVFDLLTKVRERL